MHGLSRMVILVTARLQGQLPSTLCSTEDTVYYIGMTMNTFKPGNHTSTLQMDGFVICKHGLIMTHWYTICSQAHTLGLYDMAPVSKCTTSVDYHSRTYCVVIHYKSRTYGCCMPAMWHATFFISIQKFIVISPCCYCHNETM